MSNLDSDSSKNWNHLTLTSHKVKKGVYDERSGRMVPNMKVFEDYKCPRRERWIVMDEVGRTINTSTREEAQWPHNV